MSNFHALGGLTQKEQHDSKTRTVTGNGTPFVRVPGLKKVVQVRIGSQVIPLTESRTYPKDSTGTNFINKDEELIGVAPHPEDGCPILLRSTLSNDGIWQDGSTIFVSGEWEDEAHVETPAEDPKDEANAGAPKPNTPAANTPVR